MGAVPFIKQRNVATQKKYNRLASEYILTWRRDGVFALAVFADAEAIDGDGVRGALLEQSTGCGERLPFVQVAI